MPDAERQEKSAAEMRADHEAWRDRQRVTISCALCGWTYRGTAADGRRLARDHRASEHPDVERRPRARLTPEQQRERAMLLSDWKRRKWRDDA